MKKLILLLLCLCLIGCFLMPEPFRTGGMEKPGEVEKE